MVNYRAGYTDMRRLHPPDEVVALRAFDRAACAVIAQLTSPLTSAPGLSPEHLERARLAYAQAVKE